MRMTGVDWRPFMAEFPVLFGEGKFLSLWVDEGWFEILWSLCTSLERLSETGLPEGRAPITLKQVKEKYGTLRVYVEGGSDEAMELIDAAERASETTCEVCGRPGSIECIRGWDKCLCPAHAWESRCSEVSRIVIKPDPADQQTDPWNVLSPQTSNGPRPPRLYLQDIVDAVGEIVGYTSDLDRPAFEQNEVLREAVLYQVGVIGTASRQIPLALIGHAPSASWRMARALRNHPAVECFGLDDEGLWRAIKRDLPLLAFEAEQILRSRDY